MAGTSWRDCQDAVFLFARPRSRAAVPAFLRPASRQQRLCRQRGSSSPPATGHDGRRAPGFSPVLVRIPAELAVGISLHPRAGDSVDLPEVPWLSRIKARGCELQHDGIVLRQAATGQSFINFSSIDRPIAWKLTKDRLETSR